MRLVPRFAAPVIALAVIAAGCGGSQLAFQEVPGDPPQMTVPGTAEAFAPSPTATPTATTDASTTTDTATPTPTPAAGDTTGSTTTPTTPTTQSGTDTTGTGGSTAPSTDDGATNDQPPPAGSPAQQFEDYCASNPGAC